MNRYRYSHVKLLHKLLKKADGGLLPIVDLMEKAGCSRIGLYRHLVFLRDRLGAPVLFDRERHAVRYDALKVADYELPGLWFDSQELFALAAFYQLLTHKTHSVAADALEPLKQQIEHVLINNRTGGKVELQRIRVTRSGLRQFDEYIFRQLAMAVLTRQRLVFRYKPRSTDSEGKRSVSPQRLTHYRENWYLDAWDHDRQALRSFAVDRVKDIHLSQEPAVDVPETELDTYLAGGYGIFSGPPKAWATVVFSARAARWVSEEHWHSQQEGRFLGDGRYELRVPFANAKELLMDILRYGPDAEVIAPASLREEAKIMLRLALAGYEAQSVTG